jgi:hypothetical protein
MQVMALSLFFWFTKQTGYFQCAHFSLGVTSHRRPEHDFGVSPSRWHIYYARVINITIIVQSRVFGMIGKWIWMSFASHPIDEESDFKTRTTDLRSSNGIVSVRTSRKDGLASAVAVVGAATFSTDQWSIKGGGCLVGYSSPQNVLKNLKIILNICFILMVLYAY